jgi:hypothetical protein
LGLFAFDLRFPGTEENAMITAQVGEFTSVTNYSSLADFEEKTMKLLASAEFQAAVKKLEGLLLPGAGRDHLLRQM